jgi:hypothetical protein
MATTLTIGSPKRLVLGTTTEAVTIPRDARYIRIEALSHDVVLAMTGTDGGALASDYETYPQKAIYMRSIPGMAGKGRKDGDTAHASHRDRGRRRARPGRRYARPTSRPSPRRI